ncbi:MAG: alpha/beta fold hydrolase [Acidobacteria bacterium]|nr:alpha/beta fold hydrolase [Acidobacteriota bacterium]MBV9476324.1 alpha/beta fold hydrolase [Acidobacteriota bacterium]
MFDFSPAWFLPHPHLQTVWGRLARPRKLVSFRRESLTLPDGDELLVDHLDAPVTAPDPLHFILMHGLEGSSYSVYMQGILAVIARHGHRATAINFRSCARDPRQLSRSIPNRRPRYYHSGDTADFDFVLRTLAARNPSQRFAAFGASLGGNVVLKWLGEHPGQLLVAAASTLSVPYDLGAGARHMEKTRAGRLYLAQFLVTLRKKAMRADIMPLLDLDAVRRARTFVEFDDIATAPLHGFADANDYYARSSSIHFLDRIDTPVLALNAEDDPFLPREILPRARHAASAAVDFRTTPCGGHVGFVGGRAPWKCEYWAEELVVRWITERTA